MLKYYYSKRNEPVPNALPQPPLGRQMLFFADSTHAFPCNVRYEPGAFYEIAHEKLPPKSPIQLKAVRIVMVSESTSLDVTVNFPSTLSLRSYFATGAIHDGFPELDERFVMSSNQARRILRWRIPLAELEAGKQLKSFWLLSPSSVSDLPLVVSDEEQVATTEIKPSSTCLLSLKQAGMVGWGIRRKVKYIGRHCEVIDKEEAEMEQTLSTGGIKGTRREEKIEKNKKRKKKLSGTESKRQRFELEQEGKCTRGTKDRWSTERYEAAEKRLLGIMRAKKAELGRPILRQALREEARKHIGDTGLLDHLLKHMAGKIVSDGTERFRRRHNSEGAMEYWLEPADLIETRRKAGVSDPFWVPPPGWKLGDSIIPHSCGKDCKAAIEELRQQLAAQIMKYEEQQPSLEALEKEAQESKAEAAKVVAAWQEKFHLLVEWKTKHEKEFSALFDSVQGLKEEVQLMKEKNTIEGIRRLNEDHQVPRGTLCDVSKTISGDGCITALTAKNSNTNSNSSAKMEELCAGGKKAAARRSGFRIYKPQGTFVWPSNNEAAAAAGLVISSSPRSQGVMVPTSLEQQQQQQHTMLFPGGGPPSASSSNASKPKLLLLPAPAVPTSPCLQPLAAAAADICAPSYGTMARALPASFESIGETGGRRDDALVAAGSPWKTESRGWVGLTTDLALATPSPYPPRGYKQSRQAEVGKRRGQTTLAGKRQQTVELCKAAFAA